jgi:hypothetical protein
VGVRPATDFLRDNQTADLVFHNDGSIEVDGHLRVQGVSSGNAFAGGDIARYPDAVSGELTRIEHWNVAGNHARFIARNIAAKVAHKPHLPGLRFDKVPVFWSAQGQQLRYAGVGSKWDDVIVHGDLDKLKFVAYYVRGDEVIAVSSMLNDPVVSKASTLLRHRRMPPAATVSVAIFHSSWLLL